MAKISASIFLDEPTLKQPPREIRVNVQESLYGDVSVSIDEGVTFFLAPSQALQIASDIIRGVSSMATLHTAEDTQDGGQAEEKRHAPDIDPVCGF